MTFENLVDVPGTKSQPKLVVLALSTCGFCKRAMAFLQDQGFSYQYAHLDTLDTEKKAKLKEEFKDQFGQALAFPALVLDDKEVIIGFIESRWREKLGLSEAIAQ